MGFKHGDIVHIRSDIVAGQCIDNIKVTEDMARYAGETVYIYTVLANNIYIVEQSITEQPDKNLWPEHIFSESLQKENRNVSSNTKDTQNDPVNHPSHYTTGKIEVIDYIDDKKLPYCLGNAIKYVSRAGHKDPTKRIEDLQKAVWYINHQIGLWKQEGWDTYEAQEE